MPPERWASNFHSTTCFSLRFFTTHSLTNAQMACNLTRSRVGVLRARGGSVLFLFRGAGTDARGARRVQRGSRVDGSHRTSFHEEPASGDSPGRPRGGDKCHGVRNMAIQWAGVVERVLASLIHTATRGLVYISYATGNLVPALLAISGFASIDGRAYHAHLEKWRFDDVQVLGRFYRFLAVVAVWLNLLFLSSYYYPM